MRPKNLTNLDKHHSHKIVDIVGSQKDDQQAIQQ